MAVATGLALGAAAMSGIAIGTSCSMQLGFLDGGSSTKEETTKPSAEAPTDSSKALPAVWEGFSMEEARAHADSEQSKALARSPEEVLAELQRGNARFWMNTAARPEASAFERRALISKQFPSVAILGCSDSRVPTEIVFDQGLGDIFVIRVAGNALDTATLASLQYAVHHLKVKVVVVLGHELCGAVKAAQLPNESLENEPSQLEQALKSIKAGLDQERLVYLSDHRVLDREAVATNVKAQVERLARDRGMISKVRRQELLIVGAFYEISSGIVDFFHEVSGDDTDMSPLQRQPSHGVLSRFVPEKGDRAAS
uniref:Carbonic anhydrase n=1 Tax=Zooxanthella nutricula TaxID=1333877 RepID=A0A7S2PWV4_9DINO